MTVRILVGDVREKLRTLADDSVHCVVTSPPYWGLRDYGVDGQIGLEATPGEFLATMVAVFDEVRRVLRPDGTCWINMGDSYAGGGNGGGGSFSQFGIHAGKPGSHKNDAARSGDRGANSGLKPKDLVMMPHRLAIALQDAGWWVRQDIVWAKPNPMPESVRDRCTKSHEYIFLLTKSAQYFYDAEAIKEPVTGDPDADRNRFDTKDYEIPGQTPQKRKARGVGFGHGSDAEARGRGRVVSVPSGWATGTDRAHDELTGNYTAAPTSKSGNKERKPGSARGCPADSGCNVSGSIPWEGSTRNKRSVWTMATHSFKEAHFATFPPELPEMCIKAGCPPGGVVLDPFFGAGTTGLVADRLQRDCIGIELNPVYAEIARKRIQADSPLLADVRVAA